MLVRGGKKKSIDLTIKIFNRKKFGSCNENLKLNKLFCSERKNSQLVKLKSEIVNVLSV